MSNPDFLYRVVDDRSLVKFAPETGFTAADTWTAFDPHNNPQSARAIIELHSDWDNRIYTPLISTTESEAHAWRLARNRDEYGRTNVHVAIIDRELLERQVNVYRMLSLVDTVDAKIAPKARSHWEHVCVHRIPMDTILRFYTISEFQEYLAVDDDDDTTWDYEEENWNEEDEQWSSRVCDEESQTPEDEEEKWLWGAREEPQCLLSDLGEEDESQSLSAPKDGEEVLSEDEEWLPEPEESRAHWGKEEEQSALDDDDDDSEETVLDSSIRLRVVTI